MALQRGSFVIAAVVVAVLGWAIGGTRGAQLVVGGAFWSIPADPNFYTNWSSTHSFQQGDTLYFDFQDEFHNVMQVSKQDYQRCSSARPLRSFVTGPATIPLNTTGVFYFICGVSNYCQLGQKFSVVVHPCCQPVPRSDSPSPAPSPFTEMPSPSPSASAPSKSGVGAHGASAAASRPPMLRMAGFSALCCLVMCFWNLL